MSDEPVRAEDLERAASCAAAHPHAAALGAFAHDVLTTQAEGRSLFAGQKFMSQRATEHGVGRDAAATDLGNLLAILERGPNGRSELALVAAFAVHGFGCAWEAAGEPARQDLARKLVNYNDWLQSATAYRLMPAVDRLLSAQAQAAVYDAIAAAVLREDSTDPAQDVAVRARNSARLVALAATGCPAAAALLARIRKQAKDVVTRATAAALLGEALPEPDRQRLRLFGSVATVQRRPWHSVLRWVSGWALLHFGYRVLCFFLRLQRDIELELDGSALRVHGRTTLLGRTVRHWNALYSVERVTGALRRARFALLRTIVGALALCSGVLLGGHLAFEGVRGGASLLLPLSALITALGCGLDLALYVLGDALHERVQLQVDLAEARSIRLSGVALADADRFLAALAERVAGRAS
ncbi:MAG TPA: hypothetical protein VF331_18095 [Polyangiales bacterium]